MYARRRPSNSIAVALRSWPHTTLNSCAALVGPTTTVSVGHSFSTARLTFCPNALVDQKLIGTIIVTNGGKHTIYIANELALLTALL